MQENIAPTKEDLRQDLDQAKEAVGNLKVKIENPAELEKIAHKDIEDLKNQLEMLNEEISEWEEKISILPESSNENQDIEDLKFIKNQLSLIVYATNEEMEKYFNPTSNSNENSKTEELITLNNQDKNLEVKKEFPDGHIMNPNMLDKIAQLEAIDWNTLEFKKEKYDNYINEQKKLGAFTVGENQRKIQEFLDKGKTIEKSIDKANLEPIYGMGGLNRYIINSMDGNGTVKLSRGSSNTSGSVEYKAKLAEKAKELGIKVEGQ